MLMMLHLPLALVLLMLLLQFQLFLSGVVGVILAASFQRFFHPSNLFYLLALIEWILTGDEKTNKSGREGKEKS